jgi:hypothetical protein
VQRAWNNVKDTVTTFMFCASTWHSENPIADSTEGSCKVERGLLSQALGELNKSLENSRVYSWEGWQNPETLKLKR